MNSYNIKVFVTVLITSLLLYQCAPDKNKPNLGSINVTAAISDILVESKTNEKSSNSTTKIENRAAIVQNQYQSGIFMLVPVSTKNSNKSLAELKDEALEVATIDIEKKQVQITVKVPFDIEIYGIYYLYTSRVTIDNFVSVEPDLTGITNSIKVDKGDNSNLKYELKTIKRILKVQPEDPVVVSPAEPVTPPVDPVVTPVDPVTPPVVPVVKTVSLEDVANPQYLSIDKKWVPFQNIAKDSTKDYVLYAPDLTGGPSVIQFRLPLKKQPTSEDYKIEVKATVTYSAVPSTNSGTNTNGVSQKTEEIIGDFTSPNWRNVVTSQLTFDSKNSRAVANTFTITVEITNYPGFTVTPKTYTMYYKTN